MQHMHIQMLTAPCLKLGVVGHGNLSVHSEGPPELGWGLKDARACCSQCKQQCKLQSSELRAVCLPWLAGDRLKAMQRDRLKAMRRSPSA